MIEELGVMRCDDHGLLSIKAPVMNYGVSFAMKSSKGTCNANEIHTKMQQGYAPLLLA